MANYGDFKYGVFLYEETDQADLPNATNMPATVLTDPGSFRGTANQQDDHETRKANYEEQRKMLTRIHDAVVSTFGEDKFAPLENDYGILPEYKAWELYRSLYNSYIKRKDYGKASEDTTIKMNKKWDPTTPFGTYLRRQQVYKQILVKCGDTIDNKIMIRRTLPSLEDIPDLELACDKWDSKAEADQTWANFKTHFTAEVAKAQEKGGTHKLSKIGIANQLLEANQKILDLEQRLEANETNASIRAAEQDETMKNAFMLFLENQQANMANQVKETTNPAPTNSADAALKLMQQLIENNTTKDTTKKETPVRRNTALYTPPAQTEGAVCTKVDGQEKWTATIMNTNPQINQKEERQWCQHCNAGKGKWIMKRANDHWTGTHDAWAKKRKDRITKRYHRDISQL